VDEKGEKITRQKIITKKNEVRKKRRPNNEEEQKAFS
jgi:hypothetical protein